MPFGCNVQVCTRVIEICHPALPVAKFLFNSLKFSVYLTEKGTSGIKKSLAQTLDKAELESVVWLSSYS